MTATRMQGWWWRAAIVLALASLWSYVGFELWQTRVPDGLRLPDLDPRAFFSARELDRGEDYEGFQRINFLLSTLATLLVFIVYARQGARFTRESAAGPIGTGMLLAMLGFALVWLVSVPFEIAAHWWDRRHDVSDAGYHEVLLYGWVVLGSEFLFLCFAVLVVMGLARALGRLWWIPGSAFFVGLVALFVFIYPYLVIDSKPLAEPELAAAAQKFARAQGVSDVEVEVEDVDEITDLANAYATGIGPSRKVFLWNTLLDGRFTDGEVKVVLAHEFGHHSRNHLPEAIVWYAMFAVPGAFLIALATRRRGGMGEPAAVPLSLLVLVALNLAALPLENVISRHQEAEADWVALETTRDPESMKSLFRKFSTENLGDPTPPGWAYFLLATHPSELERIAMAEAWKARRNP